MIMDYRKPLYVQLKEMLQQRIDEGEYLPGEKIPSEREMAATYNINRMTVKNAINALVDEGVLYKVKNEGTYVTKRQPKKALYFNDFSKTGRRQGLGALISSTGAYQTNKVLEKETITNKRYLEYKLGLEEGEEIYALYRLRCIDDESVALEYAYMPKKYFADIDEYDFGHVSLYDYMDSKGHLPISFKQAMSIQKVGKPYDKIMKIEDDAMIYCMEYLGKDAEGNIVEYTISRMRCDKAVYSFDTYNRKIKE